jgi:PAS domain S-box-containing protein
MGRVERMDIDVSQLFNTIPIGVIYFDSNGDFLTANTAAQEILGFGFEELVRQTKGGSFWQLLAADGSDLPLDNQPSCVALRTGKPVHDEVVGFFHPEKMTYCWLNVNAVPEFEATLDIPSRVYITIEDITSNVNARTKLQQTQTDYRMLLDNMHSGVAIIQYGIIKFVNKSLAQQTGNSPGELENTPFISHIAPEEQQRISDYYVKRLAGLEVPENYRTKILKYDGSTIWVDFRVRKLDYNGKPTLLVLLNDVDAEVRAEEQLRSSELRFRRLFQEAPIGIALVADDGKPLEVNEQLSKFSGYSRDELLKMTFADYTHPEDIGKDLSLFRELRDGKRDSYELLKRYIRKDGEIVWGGLKVGAIIDSKGEQQIIGMVEDRTDEVCTRKELEIAHDMANESSRIKSAFLASVSHELRTPLNAVLGFSDIIQNTSENESTREYSNFIYEAGFKVMTIIDDILDLAMSEHGKIRLRPAPFEVGEIFNEFRHQLYEIIYKYGKEDSVKVLDDISPSCREKNIVIDKSKVYQVIVNLVKNAVKFTEKGFIKLGCYPAGENHIAFFIQDTGIGIPDDQKEVIFDFFRQADGQDHAIYGGIGIGLAISKRIANAMHGDIKVESIPGEGTTFTLVIPADLGNEE